MSTPVIGSVSPAPTDEEAAAISAAVTLMWPQPLAPASAGAGSRPNVAWRFSGRWWASQHVVRRARPGI